MYQEIYYHTYCEEGTGANCRLSILKKDYVGEAMPVEAGPLPFTKAKVSSDYELIGGIYPTMAKIQLLGTDTFGMDDLYTADDSLYKVVHYVEEEVDWEGFITPEGFGELDTEEYRILNINCFDGLTRLKTLAFVDEAGNNYGDRPAPTETLLYVLKEGLKKTGLALEILTLVDRVPFTGRTFYNMTPFSPVVNPGGWLYDQEFNGESNAEVGNYFVYEYQDTPGIYVSLITEVDSSEVGGGGGLGIRLNPALPDMAGTGPLLNGEFVVATGNNNEDVLAQASHDMRIWIDPEAKVRKTYKADEVAPYYSFPEAAWTSWDVLDGIARALDFQITQDRGRWVAQTMDINRVGDDYFLYDSEGVFIDRVSQPSAVEIPECADDLFYREEGSSRYFQNAVKAVSVQYPYRMNTIGDIMPSKILNGDFIAPTGNHPPESFTPDSWTRNNGDITFEIHRPTVPLYIEFRTPDPGFNKNSWLKADAFDVKEGDTVVLGWSQSLLEYDNMRMGTFGVITIRHVALNGDVNYFVNSGDQDGWVTKGDTTQRDRRLYQSGKPLGRWFESTIAEPYHFVLNHSTEHNFNAGWSAMSPVEITLENVPADGRIEFMINGAAGRIFTPAGSTERVPSFIPAEPIDYDTDGVQYVENTYENTSDMLLWRKYGGVDFVIRVTDVFANIVREGSDRMGRVYEYVQEADYGDDLGPVTVPFGDERNEDAINKIFVGGYVRPMWLTRDGSLQAGPLGLLLARSIMRRYHQPMRRIDGRFGFLPQNLTSILTLGQYGDTTWGVLSGDMNPKESSFSGTIYQMSQVSLPIGGVDYGPNSLQEQSEGSGGGGSGGSSGSGSGGGGVATKSLQDVTSVGASTNRVISVAGLRSGGLFSIPTEPPEEEQELEGERYLYVQGSRLVFGPGATRVEVGDSTRWGGRVYEDTFDQELKTTSDVQFSTVVTDGFFIDITAEPPASPTSEGIKGSVVISEEHIYVCVAENTWVRTTLSTW